MILNVKQVCWIALCGALAIPAAGQDSNYGFSLPVTLSGSAMDTGRVHSRIPALFQSQADSGSCCTRR